VAICPPRPSRCFGAWLHAADSLLAATGDAERDRRDRRSRFHLLNGGALSAALDCGRSATGTLPLRFGLGTGMKLALIYAGGGALTVMIGIAELSLAHAEGAGDCPAVLGGAARRRLRDGLGRRDAVRRERRDWVLAAFLRRLDLELRRPGASRASSG
jgi:hypothetical protein